ncbi:MAG: response regulator receiver protein [Parcubacteria group bacterium Gr01-1014_30]|nr:MAG: response regulator receiver protein [Parcubacteria group bacterium Gr01-1014_30]
MKSILLVEDDPFLIDIYSTKLKEAGFSVDVAPSGKECLQKLKQELPDLLLLDIVLPEVDGWEIIRKIKEDAKLKDLKVVVLSNLGQKDEVEKGLAFGAVKYLIKAHYTPSEVVNAIKEITV